MDKMNNLQVQKIAVTVTGILGVVSNAMSGPGGDGGIATVSRDNPTWLTPDGPTFIIWALIFTLLIALVIAQWCPDAETEELLSQQCHLTKLQVRWRISLYLLMNALWPPLFMRSRFLAALLVVLVYLGGLLSVLTALNTKASVRVCQWVLFVAPNVVHASWVATATILTFLTWAGTLGWKDEFGIAGSPQAAIAILALLIGVAGIVAIMRLEFAWSAVTAWAAAGIYRMQTGSDPNSFPAEALNESVATAAKWSVIAASAFTLIGAMLLAYDRCRSSSDAHKLLPMA